MPQNAQKNGAVARRTTVRTAVSEPARRFTVPKTISSVRIPQRSAGSRTANSLIPKIRQAMPPIWKYRGGFPSNVVISPLWISMGSTKLSERAMFRQMLP